MKGPKRAKIVGGMRAIFVGAAVFDWAQMTEHLVITLLLWLIWELS